MHVPHLAQLAVPHPRPRLLHQRVEADVEVRAMHETALIGECGQLLRLGRGDRKRLLADDVLPGGEDRLHLRVVKIVRRREMDDIDAVVRQERVEIRAHRPQPLGFGSPRTRPDHAHHLDAETPERVDVDGGDEACADDAGAKLLDAARHSAAVARA